MLSVSVHQGDKVETFFNCVVEPNLLVSAVALIDRVKEHMQRKRQFRQFAHGVAPFERLILRRVVNDQDFDVVFFSSEAGMRRNTSSIVFSAL